MLDITAHAPAGALCADCGCGCAGETVVIERRAGPLGGTLRTYRHLHSDDCQAARTRSDRFWSNAGARQLAWCDAADAEIAAARDK